MADDLNRFGSIFEDAYKQTEAFKEYWNDTLNQMEQHFRQSIGAMGRELTEEEDRQFRQRASNAEQELNNNMRQAERVASRRRQLEQDIETTRDRVFDAQQRGDRDALQQAQREFQAAQQRMTDYNNIGASTNKNISGQIASGINTATGLLGGQGVTGLGGIADLGIQAVSMIPVVGPIAGALGNAIKAVGEMLASQIAKLSQILDNRIGEASTNLKSYTSAVNTRLQGTSVDYDNIVTKLIENTQHIAETSTKVFSMVIPGVKLVTEEGKKDIGIAAYQIRREAEISALIDRKTFTDNIGKLAESGISYNLEQRALLMTLSDRIATTFDALDKSLTRLIRLQQEDMTSTALASEASITNFLNTYYADSSYMNERYDSVTSNILEATSQMTVNQATSFSYAVQKWLGALYSLGLSDEAVDMISKGLGYLSTGNISQLQGSSQTLMAMSAQRAGISYSDILTRGLDAATVDNLMVAMVSYLADISNNTSNQVVKSQWSEIFGVSMSDLRAIANLNHEDIMALSETVNLDKDLAQKELGYQYSQLLNRMSVQELLDTVVSNMAFGTGMYIAQDFNKYANWFEQQFKEERAMDNIFTKSKFFFQDLFRLSDATEYNEIASLSRMVEELQTLKGGTDSAFLDYILNDSSGRYLGLYRGLWGESPTNIHHRGDKFTGLDTIRTASDIDDILSQVGPSFNRTMSSSATYTRNAAINAVQSLGDVEQEVQNSNQTITGQNEEIISTIDKLYSMLFEDQTTPIKVQIEGSSDDFNKFLSEMLSSNISSLSSDVDRYISNSSNYVDNLTRALYSIRGM